MAIVVSNVTSGSTTGSSSATASITTVTGQLYFTYMFSYVGATPSMSNGLGLIWTQIGSTITDGSGFTFILYYAVCTSGATGTLTATVSAFGGGFWVIDTCTGTSGSPIVQTVTNTSGTTTSPISITLATFGSVSNAAYAAWVIDAAPTGTITPKSGWTAAKASAVFLTGYQTASEYIASNDTSPNATFTGTATGAYGWAVEIAVPVINASNCTIKNSMMMMGCGI